MSGATINPILLTEIKPFIFTVKTDNTGDTNDNQFLLKGNIGDNYNIKTVQHNITSVTGDYTLTFSEAGTYDIEITGRKERPFFTILNGTGDDQNKIIDVKQWGTIPWTSMDGLFHKNGSISTLSATDVPNLRYVKNMQYTFSDGTFNCPKINNWDVKNVTSMALCFFKNKTFNFQSQSLNKWDTGKVTNMNSMFQETYTSGIDLSGWDVKNVTSMNSMFRDCYNYMGYGFDYPFRKWDTGKVTNMKSMFQGCSNFNGEISYWCVKNIASKPTNFDTGATSWSEANKPVWGTCPW